jgi:lysine 6-dehydrogenase
VGGYRYGILGAGRQGIAAAYDLVVCGEAGSVVLGDISLERAVAAADRVNRLTGKALAESAAVDASKAAALSKFLEPLDAVVSSASWRLNLSASEAAIEARTHMCDLGGNVGVVRGQLALDARARERGVCLVPDCGEAPGLSNNLLAYAMTLLGETEDLLLLDGGLPENPVPPWNFALTFNVDGLTNEYDGTTTFILDGQPVEVQCLDPSEYELVEFEPPLGTLEAFPAATGSTTPWTLGPKLGTLKAKVLRYPGHAAQFGAFRDLGLFSEEPIAIQAVPMVPRELFHSLLEPKIRAEAGTRDVVVARVVARGTRDRRQTQVTLDLRVRYDDELGLTAMEQATGWHAAIVCHLMASGGIPPGATPVELAVDPAFMMAELRRRGFELTVKQGG